MCGNTNDQYVVFADIINKITRTNGKVRENQKDQWQGTKGINNSSCWNFFAHYWATVQAYAANQTFSIWLSIWYDCLNIWKLIGGTEVCRDIFYDCIWSSVRILGVVNFPNLQIRGSWVKVPSASAQACKHFAKIMPKNVQILSKYCGWIVEILCNLANQRILSGRAICKWSADNWNWRRLFLPPGTHSPHIILILSVSKYFANILQNYCAIEKNVFFLPPGPAPTQISVDIDSHIDSQCANILQTFCKQYAKIENILTARPAPTLCVPLDIDSHAHKK